MFYSIFFVHMFTVKRLHRLTEYRVSSPEGFSMMNMLVSYMCLAQVQNISSYSCKAVIHFELGSALLTLSNWSE